MSVVKSKIRIANKIDTIDNWSASQLSLLNGEIAIISCANDDIRMKVGNGISAIADLPFVGQKQIDDAMKPLSSNTYQLSSTELSTYIIDIVKALGGKVYNGDVML